MSDFFSATRKPSENILCYFMRILTLYKSSNDFSSDSWMSDRVHVIAIFAKLLASLYSETRSEIKRRVEPEITK